MHFLTLRRCAAGFAAAFIGVLTLAPGLASAHERRTVGNYSFLVGFNSEPAIQGEMNGAQVTVTKPSDNNRPIDGLQSTLKLGVAIGGGQPQEFPLTPASGKPGQYVGEFIPTRSGSYIFTFTGTVEGQTVNERFESGPGRFNDVDPITMYQFPDQVPLANDAARAATSAESTAVAAQASADSARTIGMAGWGIGAIGIIVGVAGLIAGSKRSREIGEQVRPA